MSPAPKKLSFHATKVTADVDADVQTLGFEIAQDGEPSVYFNIVNDAPGSVRIWWSDGKLRREESVVAIGTSALEDTRIRLEFKDPTAERTGPYKGVELTFDELDEDLGPAVAEAFAKLFAPPPPPPKVLVGPRKRGTPQLGVLATSRAEWRMRVGDELPLELLVTNTGGGVQGLVLDIAGAAIANVEVRGAKAQDKSAKVEPQKTAVRAVLEQVVVDADHDVDRKTFDRSGPPPPAPKFPLTVVVKGVKAGTALLTIRVTPRTADGRGSAMVGRTIFVDP